MSDIKVRLASKRKELDRVSKEYKSLLEEYEKEKYGGLSRAEYVERIKQEKAAAALTKKIAYSKKLEEELRINATDSEKRFRAKLKFANVRFDFQKTFLDNNSWYIADFYLPDYNMIVEIDGGYHRNADQKKKDRKRDSFFRKLGYIVFRIKNADADNVSADEVVNLIKKYAKSYLKRV